MYALTDSSQRSAWQQVCLAAVFRCMHFMSLLYSVAIAFVLESELRL